MEAGKANIGTAKDMNAINQYKYGYQISKSAKSYRRVRRFRLMGIIFLVIAMAALFAAETYAGPQVKNGPVSYIESSDGPVASIEIRAGSEVSWSRLRTSLFSKMQEKCGGVFALVSFQKSAMSSLPGRQDAKIVIGNYSCKPAAVEHAKMILAGN